MRNRYSLIHACGLALFGWSLVCAAESDFGPAEIDEIVVSGYRPTPARELGSSVSVLTGGDLATGNFEHFQDLIRLVPNMNLSGEGSRARYFQIRGIGEREQYEGAPNPSVGFIVDDIDLSGIGGVTSNFDLERVEVLRGPQSARYGSSALAGIVYAQSAAPDDELSGNAELGAGSDTTRSAGLAVGGPLGEHAAGRFSVYRYQDDGFRNNAFLNRDDTNSRDELTIRGKIRWRFAQDFEALLATMYADFDNDYDAFALDNSATTFSDEPGEDSQETAAASLRIAGALSPAVELLSISSGTSSEIVFSYDGDWVNESFWLPIVSDYRYRNPRDRDSLSQEFRLLSGPEGRLFSDSTDWVVGIFWRRLDENNFIDSTGEYIETADGCDPGFCLTDRQVRSTYSADSTAVFAGLDSAITDKLDISAGLRVERWDADYGDNWIDNGVFGGPVEASNRFSPDDSMVGGHISLGYDWNDVLRGYARIARGYKAGGFNPSLAALGALPGAPDPNFIAFTPEYVWNYELGIKWLGLDGSLTADASVYYMTRDDAQLSQSSQVDPFDPNSFFFVTGNGEANVYGLDSAFTWQVGDAWQLQGALGLLESEIDAWAIRPAVVGRELAHAPGYTLSLGATWQGVSGWFVRADAVAVDSFYFDISNDQKSDSYQLVNMSVGKKFEHWSATLWSRNLFDAEYQTRGFFFGNEPPAFTPALYTRFGDPRQVGLTLRYEF